MFWERIQINGNYQYDERFTINIFHENSVLKYDQKLRESTLVIMVHLFARYYGYYNNGILIVNPEIVQQLNG